MTKNVYYREICRRVDIKTMNAKKVVRTIKHFHFIHDFKFRIKIQKRKIFI